MTTSVAKYVKYCTVVVYAGEIAHIPMEPDCWQFDSAAEAANWFVDNGISRTPAAAKTGISNTLNGKIKHYKGYTFSVAFTDDYSGKRSEL